MANLFTRIYRSERGQTMMEYIILASLIGIFCLGVTKQFGSVLQNRIENMKQKISSQIKID